MISLSSAGSSSPPSSPSSGSATSFVDLQSGETSGTPSGEANDTPNEDSLEYFISNTSKLQASDKNRYILGACYGVVPGFTLKAEPYRYHCC